MIRIAALLLATLPAFAASKPPKPVTDLQPRLCSPGGLPIMVPCPR